jgi:hypothetical protein
MKNICANCKYAGKQFKAYKITHLHCENPERFTQEQKDNDVITAWDTLEEWYSTCDKFTLKQLNK